MFTTCVLNFIPQRQISNSELANKCSCGRGVHNIVHQRFNFAIPPGPLPRRASSPSPASRIYLRFGSRARFILNMSVIIIIQLYHTSFSSEIPMLILTLSFRLNAIHTTKVNVVVPKANSR